jgi:DNA-binding NtrC family response regulator
MSANDSARPPARPARGQRPVTSLLEDAPAFTRQLGGQFAVVRGPDKGLVFPFTGGPVCFGSDAACDVVLNDTAVSRRHLLAIQEGPQLILRDLGSTNGSYIEGARFKEIAIGFGTEFRLGRSVVKYIPEEEEIQLGETESDRFGTLVGRHPVMRRMFALLSEAAPSDATVILEGETGTGKELVAEQIHKHSRRNTGPFVVFDCGAAPRDLIESALFGHVKGAFTGAIADRKGAFAEAHGGTLFLDEIGELAIDLQPKLLRALDKRHVQRVGSTGYEPVDVRIVAATNRDLPKAILKKEFREDLYYRLAVIRISLPPLRARGDDVVLIAENFVRDLTGGQVNSLPADGVELLRRHTWPGNVRELRNVCERAVRLAQNGMIDFEEALRGVGAFDPPSADAAGQAGGPAMSVRTDLPFKVAKGELVERFEKEYLADLVAKYKGNLSRASREAGLDRKHLRELLRKHGLDPRSEGSEDSIIDED